MADRDLNSEEDTLEVEEAFLLLADETRVRIIAELGRAWSNDWPGIVSYSDLMERVGAKDSGGFNYHLQKLTGIYVDESDEGYSLTFPGVRMYHSIVAGTLTEDAEIDPFTLDETCFDCGARLEAEYLDNRIKILCSGCEARYFESPLPPRGAKEYSNEELLFATAQRERSRLSQFLDGVCPWCASPASHRIESPETSTLAAEANTLFDTTIIQKCGTCGDLHGHSVGEAVVDHPAVVSFYHDHGEDISSIPSWELEFATTDHYLQTISRNPWKFKLQIPLADDVLELTIDESLNVTTTQRYGRSSTPDG